MVTENLHLRVEEPDDLILVSACIQDMAIRAADVGWQPGPQRLVLLGNRFRWENAALGPRAGGGASRVRAALRFDFVQSVRRRNWPADGNTVLALMAITFEDDDSLLLSFGGGIALALQQEVLDATLEDISGPWGTAHVPDHDDA